MPIEFPRWWIKKENSIHNIMLGTAFKPYEKADHFCRPGEGKKPFIVPESYSHILALRHQMSLYGMKGCIDIISEDPIAGYAALLARFPLTQPLGVAAFVIDYYGKNDQRVREEPYILRFSFIARTKAEYAKLLNSYVDVKCGQKQYILPWNLNQKAVRRNIESLESGKKLLIVEKNLLDMQEFEKLEPSKNDKEGDNPEVERLSYAWLPKDLQKLQTITLTFRQFDHGSDQESPSEPNDPTREKEPVFT